MSSIAKRYVKALMKSVESSSLNSYLDGFRVLSIAYENEKFKDIIASPEVEVSKKQELVLSVLNSDNTKLINLIKLLAEKNRFTSIPEIYAELRYQVSLVNNRFEGIVYTNKEISGDDIVKLEDNFSKKLNSNIVLSQKVVNFDGIKVEVVDLGVEIGFSKERLEDQMLDFILKAI
jgi:F-type H+-transporting ATPase subunit delta